MSKKRYNITTQDILDYIALEGERQSKGSVQRDYYISVKEQMKLESEFLTSYQSCPDGIDSKDLIPYLYNLDPETLKNEINENYYNGELMKVLTCISSSFTVYTGENSLSGNERIREFITKLRQIGAESVNGFALTASLKDKDNFFIVKAPRDPTNNELLHEVSVAFMGLNNLRNPLPVREKNGMKYGMAIPNFANIYGMVHCSQPFIDSSEKGKKEVLAWCNKHNLAVDYAIYENVSPGIDFSTFNKTCNPNEFIMYYLQTLLALREAILRCGFTHYDLHTENGILRKVSENDIYIPYFTSKGKEYIKSYGIIVTIIDFGTSHVEEYTKDGRTIHYGKTGTQSMDKYGIYRDKCNPICDVYKLLCFSLMDMYYAKNFKCFNIISKLLKYFNKTEDPIEIIKRQEPGKTYYFLPYDEVTKNFNIDDFIQYCRKFIFENDLEDPLYDQPPEDSNVINCEKYCKNFNEEMNIIGLDINRDIPIPVTFTSFYDSFGSLKYKYEITEEIREKKRIKNLYTGLAKGFLKNLGKALKYETKKVEKNEMNIKKEEILKVELPMNNLFDDSVFSMVKNAYSKYIKFFNSYEEIKKTKKILEYILKIIRPNTNYKKYDKILDEIKELDKHVNDLIYNNSNFYNELKRKLEDDTEKINRLDRKQILKQIKKGNLDKKYLWYFNYGSILIIT
uniref:Protein kinase domain-containing protein n=1 Tax=viral metagenome TaxID=1070528 RepID=A0A6C0AEG7_9ZZZZ